MDYGGFRVSSGMQEIAVFVGWALLLSFSRGFWRERDGFRISVRRPYFRREIAINLVRNVIARFYRDVHAKGNNKGGGGRLDPGLGGKFVFLEKAGRCRTRSRLDQNGRATLNWVLRESRQEKQNVSK